MLIGDAYIAIKPDVKSGQFASQVQRDVSGPLDKAAARMSDSVTAATERATAGMRERFSSAASHIGGRLDDVGRSATRSGAVMTAGLTLPILAGFNRASQAASDLAESTNKAAVVFGASSRKVLDWSTTTAKASGISKQAALEASSSFGNMFRTTGLAEAAAADMSITMSNLASDMASFNNQDPSEMLLNLRSGLAGEAEPLRRFGVLLSEAGVKAEAMKMGLGNAKGELTEAEKVQARYSLILAQTTLQQGDFARTADGVANKTRIMAARADDAAAAFGERLLPIKERVLDVGTRLLEMFNNMSPAMQGTVVKVALVAAAVGPLTFAFGAATRAVGGLVSALGFLAAHPVVAAIGLIVGALLLWKNAQSNAKREMEALSGQIDIQTGKWTQLGKEMLYTRLVEDGTIASARKLGLSMRDVMLAAEGNEGAQRRVSAALDTQKTKLQDLRGGMDRFGRTQAQLSKDIYGVENALGRETTKLDGAAAAARRKAEALGEIAPAGQKAIGAMDGIAATAQGLAARMGAAGRNIGSQLARGIGQGLGLGIPAAVGAVNRVVDSVEAAARRRAAIQSPSRVFAENVGLPIAEGIALGIENGQITVTKAMTETLDKLFKENGAVRAVVNEARALGVTIPDEMAEAIAKGAIPVGAAMNAVMDAASQIAEARGKEIADGINAQLGVIAGGFGGFFGLSGAKRSLRQAEADLASAVARRASLPGDIRRQEELIAQLSRESRAVTASEEIAIVQARQAIREAEEKLTETREDSEATTDDVRLAELELIRARETLTAAEKDAVAPTQRIREEARKLAEMYDEQGAIIQRVKDAQQALVETQLRLVEAQRSFEESQKRLIEQGPAGIDVFTRIAERAGLSKEVIDALARSVFDLSKELGNLPPLPDSAGTGGTKPKTGGTKPKTGGVSGPTEEQQSRIDTLTKRLSNSNVSDENAAKYRKELEGMGVKAPASSRNTTVNITAPVQRMDERTLAKELQRIDDMAGR